jgi:hypothetical protein
VGKLHVWQVLYTRSVGKEALPNKGVIGKEFKDEM